jgi:hypothetical protein
MVGVCFKWQTVTVHSHSPDRPLTQEGHALPYTLLEKASRKYNQLVCSCASLSRAV